MMNTLKEQYFTQTWFDDTARKVWEVLLLRIKPVRVLEIGSFEGASACFVIEACKWSSTLELHCVDTWLGGREHVAASIDMVEQIWSDVCRRSLPSSVTRQTMQRSLQRS